jgi:hypothetical protein
MDRQVPRQPAVPLLGVLERHGVGPLPAERLDELLCLAVRLRGVGPGTDVPQAQSPAGLGERPGEVGRTVVAHHSPKLHPLSVEPGDRTAEKDHRLLLLVLQAFDVREPCRVVHGDMDLVIADAVGAALLPITGDPVADLTEPGQRLDVDVDQVARSLPLVPLLWGLGLQVPETAQPQSAESPGDDGEGSPQQAGNVPEVESLVAEIHSLLDLLRIDAAMRSQPAVGAAEADPVLGVQLPEDAAVIQVLGHEPERAILCQTGIGMAMDGCVMSELVGRTSTRSAPEQVGSTILTQCKLVPVRRLNHYRKAQKKTMAAHAVNDKFITWLLTH